MCFQASSPHNVKQCKSSIEISWTQRWPPRMTSDKRAHSPPNTPNTDTLLKWKSGIYPPASVLHPGGSQRCLSHLLRESCWFDDVGWIKTQRSQLRIIKHWFKNDQQVWTRSWKPNAERLELSADSTKHHGLKMPITGLTDRTKALVSQRLCLCLHARAHMFSDRSCRQEQLGVVSD